MTSPAAQAKAKVLARLAAEADAAHAAVAAAASATDGVRTDQIGVVDQLGPGAGLDPDAPPTVVETTIHRRETPARRHRLIHAASASAGVMAGYLDTPIAVAAANDRQGAPRPGGGSTNQILLQLAADRRRLKAIKSITAKIELKRELVPAYDAWIAGILKAREDGGRYVQDDILTAMLCWSIDIGDFDRAMPLVRYALEGGLALPEMDRDVATFVVEESADLALARFKEGGEAATSFPGGVLLEIEALTEDLDMHDQVRAKLMRAIGEAILVTIPADAEDDDYRGGKGAALRYFIRARALSPAVGVAKAIERLERDLKKLAPGAGPAAFDFAALIEEARLEDAARTAAARQTEQPESSPEETD